MILKSNFSKRLLASLVLITFFYLVVVGKLFFVQIVDGSTLQARAMDQWTRDIPLKAERGAIYDINGELLAGTQTSYTVYARPINISDKSVVAKVVASATGLDEASILSKLEKKGQSEITLAKKITKEAMNQIKQSGVQGVYFSKDISRYYPYGNFASALLGFCNTDTVGQTGIELYYDDYLRGVDGEELTETDIVGRELDDNIYYLPSIEGFDLVLSVDKSIQYFAETAVMSAVKKHSSKSACCVVMNLHSGGVAAMAQYPSFDLNNIDRNNINGLFEMIKLSPISNVFETGSVFKIITIAAALEEGLVSENERFYCGGSRVVDGQKIKCWKTAGHGSQSFAEGVQNSCNCVFMDLALRVGLQKMYSYYQKFHLTEKTEIDFLGESKGLLIPMSSAKNVDLARMGFGQAIAVTPIELVSAVGAIVSGGIYKNPYLLESASDKKGNKVYKRQCFNNERIISEKTSEIVRRLLLGVVDKGSGRLAGVDGYSIGGKTGTAQKYKDGGIDRGKYISSFIGYSTYEDPKYLVYFYVDEPQGYLYYGSLVAAPFVGEIFERIFAYENTPQSKPNEELETFVLPDFEGMSYEQVKKVCKDLGIYFEVDGSGVVKSQFPYPHTEVTKKCVLFVGME